MLWNADLVSWLCWLFPIIGAGFALVLAKISSRLRNMVVILFSFLGWLMAVFMIPDLFSYSFVDRQLFWFSLPTGGQISFGVLIDPLSIILANIVSFLGLMILIYSLKYVEQEENTTRFWFLMSLFLGSMLLLVLADNFIFFFIGWKLVGLCSFGLISYYYHDEKDHWIGGPSPFPFQKPSRAGLKALLITTFGDISLLAGILVLYSYAGTFNFMQLYQTAGGVSGWLAAMAKNPGILALTSILVLGGPIAKSAQFPLHEWLPEAMAGPTPVSALIHAATMVKAGVYLIARLLPIFFIALWGAPAYQEASTFFILAAAIGGFTLILGASQALVSKELKKALAYSTMSAIGYMVLALGVGGLSPNALVDGVASGLFHLVNHGIFKAALFLSAGIVIHASGSIYLSDMNLSKRNMRYTYVFMWIAALSLIGVPPLSGFWSKDEILLSCWQGGQYGLFLVALLGIILTTLYVVRFMGMIFHPKKETPPSSVPNQHRESDFLMLLPLGVMAGLTVVIGLAGPWVNGFFHDVIRNYFTQSLGLIAVQPVVSVPGSLLVDVFLAIDSTLMIIIGAVPAYWFFIAHRKSSEDLLNKHKSLGRIHDFLWNRWYIDGFYNKLFVNTLWIRVPLVRLVEGGLDKALNVGVPRVFSKAQGGIKKVQTGILSVNMLFVMGFMVVLVFVLWWIGVI